MTFILGLATVGLLAATVFYLKKISEQQTQIMRRMEILELTALEGGKEVHREEVAHPPERFADWFARARLCFARRKRQTRFA